MTDWADERAIRIVTWIASDSKGIDIPITAGVRRTVAAIEERVAQELRIAYLMGQKSTRHPGENQ